MQQVPVPYSGPAQAPASAVERAPPQPSTSAATLDDSLAAISLSSKVPEFWADMPRVWFAQMEAILAPQKMGDEAKFNVAVAKLNKEVIQNISDIILKPPERNKFDALKERLLTIYEESEGRKVHRLISEMDLGDQRPSQLLRRMRDLARDKLPDGTLRILWQGHLPPPVRAVLAITDSSDLDNLAQVADKIMESSSITQVNEVTRDPAENKILAEIAKLSGRITDLERASWQRGRSRNRGNREGRSVSRSRGVSGSRRDATSPGWLCTYHFRFGERAYRCSEPCAWKKQKEQKEQEEGN